MATEPRVAQVRHVANAACLIHWENAQHGAKNVIIVEIKIILVHVVNQSRRAPRTAREHPMAGAPWDAIRVGPDGPSQDLEAWSNTQSAHSIGLNSFQDHPQFHGRHSSNVHESLPNELYGRHSFQDHEESTKFVKKTFHTIYRSKSVSSVSNEMYPDGKTKILTILNIEFPHWQSIDNLQVKVDDGAEASILPLDSFRTMFPHALDEHGYPTAGFLKRFQPGSSFQDHLISRPLYLNLGQN